MALHTKQSLHYFAEIHKMIHCLAKLLLLASLINIVFSLLS